MKNELTERFYDKDGKSKVILSGTLHFKSECLVYKSACLYANVSFNNGMPWSVKLGSRGSQSVFKNRKFKKGEIYEVTIRHGTKSRGNFFMERTWNYKEGFNTIRSYRLYHKSGVNVYNYDPLSGGPLCESIKLANHFDAAERTKRSCYSDGFTRRVWLSIKIRRVKSVRQK